MRRPPSIRALVPPGASVFVAFVATVLVACLRGELIDVGSNLDASTPPRDSETLPAPEASLETSVVPNDASGDGLVDSHGEAAADGRAPEVLALCISNPSFETMPPDAPGTATPVQAAPAGWQACNGASGASASSCSLSATAGSSCVGLSVGFPFLSAAGSVDFVPCVPLEVGVAYALTVDVAFDAPTADGGQSGEPPVLQLRGSSTAACDPQADLLWRFSGISSACGWKTLCGMFVPRISYSHLILVPEVSSSTSVAFLQTNVLVDNLRFEGACSTR